MIPKGHLLYSETNEPINPNELLPYDLLIPSRESRQGEIHGWFSDPQSMPIIRGRVAHMMNAYELSKNGVGIAIYPESISSLVRDREVCIRQINHPDAKAFYALIWKKDRNLLSLSRRNSSLRWFSGNLRCTGSCPKDHTESILRRRALTPRSGRSLRTAVMRRESGCLLYTSPSPRDCS